MQADKYSIFLKWFKENGGQYSHVRFPIHFPPTNYVGLTAASSIPQNTVIAKIPKNIIIGVSLVEQSQLSPLIKKYQLLGGAQSDHRDFAILTLYLIFHRMKGQQSFYFPYLNCIDSSETMLQWQRQDIVELKDAYLTADYLDELKSQINEVYAGLRDIVEQNGQYFNGSLSQQLFEECYGLVMTRSFGWSLPETMLVPFLDLLNHNANGVHHYVFSECLQHSNNKEYIKKVRELDLRAVGINNKKKLPIDYEKDQRQLLLEKNRKYLSSINKADLPKDIRLLSNQQLKSNLKAVQIQEILKSYKAQMLLSSDQQDNDSQEEEYTQNGEHIFLTKMFDFIKTKQEQSFNQPKPYVNREFDEEVTFSWWGKQQDASIIVASAHKIDENQQIFNCYGRRSNRFLLLWYGFTYPGNKYDSVAFRVWDQTVLQKGGELLYLGMKKERGDFVGVGKQYFHKDYLSPEFRLKLSSINYELMLYLRFRLVKTAYTQCNINQVHQISNLQMEKQVIARYRQIIEQLNHILHPIPKQTTLNHQRRHYAQILVESDQNILRVHFEGVKNLQTIIDELLQKQTIERLNQLYNSEWASDVSRQKRGEGRMFVRHYMRLLESFLVK